jgi:hypothetical protein
MNIGIIGTGNMAGALGKLWAARGHRIFFGSRTPQKGKLLAQAVGENVEGGSSAEAAENADVLLLAIPWEAVHDTLHAVGSLAGKIVIDCINPVGPGYSVAVGHSTSAAEEIAKQAPGARVVKAFNSIHWANLSRPDFAGTRSAMLYCGDDAVAKYVVAKLGEDLGFKSVDCGMLSGARLLEPLGILWMQIAFPQQRGTDFAFGLLER